jgi:hypothetical protein
VIAGVVFCPAYCTWYNLVIGKVKKFFCGVNTISAEILMYAWHFWLKQQKMPANAQKTRENANKSCQTTIFF